MNSTPFLILCAMLPTLMLGENIPITDTQGRTIQAEVISIQNGNVSVKKEGTKNFDIPLAKLSEASRKTVETEIAKNSGVFVTSLIVKHVGSKYRYFFDIRNKGPEDWSGSVTIAIANKRVTNGEETFKSKLPFSSGMGYFGFIEVFTGPASVHGDDGVVSFRYSVTDATGKQINTGTGDISTKLEDLAM